MPLTVDIEKRFGDFRLSMAFSVENEVLSLLGASGCGKSMTLKCIAGVIRPDRGHIELNGRVLFDSEKKISLPPQERRVGYLFQQYALFPQMTVRQNIACGVREGNRKAKLQAADEMIRRMRLTGLEDLKPAQLSGGQQQRTALARILVNDPHVLLLDEPFSALDSHLRFRMEEEVRRVLEHFDYPVVLVSHNRDEVFRLSDQIAVVRNGQIEAFGPRHALFANPRTRQGAILTGCKNVSPAGKAKNGLMYAENWGIALRVAHPEEPTAYLGIRMHDIRPAREKEGVNVFPCRITEVIENPFSYTVMLLPEGAESASPIGWEMGKPLWESIRAERVTVCLPPEAILQLEA